MFFLSFGKFINAEKIVYKEYSASGSNTKNKVQVVQHFFEKYTSQISKYPLFSFCIKNIYKDYNINFWEKVLIYTIYSK